MKYQLLKSLIAKNKERIPLMNPSRSFFDVTEALADYVPPTFTKKDHPKEQHSILLIEAVGASGKTTTAKMLSHDLGMPLLDLAKHEAVGANTLTGLLTGAYELSSLGRVLTGLGTGSFGVLIDGLDEARTKTTAAGFEAFLNDVIKLGKASAAPSIIILGRGQVLFSTWCHLSEGGADVGWLEIDPFGLDQAKQYIDKKVGSISDGQRGNYDEARDMILERLNRAFIKSDGGRRDTFNAFIGYPPVLEAVATLLCKESNYYKLIQHLSDEGNAGMEVDLLIRICEYLMDREREMKAFPIFIDELLTKVDPAYASELRVSLYSRSEQCARILAQALGTAYPLECITRDRLLNDKYEEAVATWGNDHPFHSDNKLRNVVFEAMAVAVCASSGLREHVDIALAYAAKHQPSYHLLYIIERIVRAGMMDPRCFNMLVQSSADFLSNKSAIRVELLGGDWEEDEEELAAVDQEAGSSELELTIEFPDLEQERSFRFHGRPGGTPSLSLGPILINTTVHHSGTVSLEGTSALEVVGTCSISAKNVEIRAKELVLTPKSIATTGTDELGQGLFIMTAHLSGHVDEVLLNGGTVQLDCIESEATYPLQKYFKRLQRASGDPLMRKKYLRARRILMEFRSHSKGALAKFEDKIQHQRVLKDDLGRSVLKHLLKEGVLSHVQPMYYIIPDKHAAVIGLSYHQIRMQQSSPKLDAFLSRVK
jgi:hypothetical protein